MATNARGSDASHKAPGPQASVEFGLFSTSPLVHGDGVRLLFDILHPTHVHIFRNLIRELTARGHAVHVTMREKDVAKALLEQYGLPHEVLSRQRSGLGLAFEFVERGARLWRSIARFRPDFLVGCMGPSIASVGRLRRLLAADHARIVVFYDTEMANLTNSFVYPLADLVCTADSYHGMVRGHHLTYASYQQLAYLHPRRFTPDEDVVRSLGIEPSSRYFLLRFVSYQSSHDLGVRGIPLEKQVALVRALSRHGRVLISSEKALARELEPHAFRLPASSMHHVLAFASLLVGESATMASEAACLGVTAVYISPHGRGYTDDQERRYGLVHNFTGARYTDDWVRHAEQLAADENLVPRAREAQKRLLSEKIDVTEWMLTLLEREYARGSRAVISPASRRD
jgi:predicted glycosyltransferase